MDEKLDVVRVPAPRRGDVELAVRETGPLEPDADPRERLRLVDRERKGEAERELASLPREPPGGLRGVQGDARDEDGLAEELPAARDLALEDSALEHPLKMSLVPLQMPADGFKLRRRMRVVPSFSSSV